MRGMEVDGFWVLGMMGRRINRLRLTGIVMANQGETKVMMMMVGIVRWKWKKWTCMFCINIWNGPKSHLISSPGAAQPDPDLREYQRGLALAAADERASKPGPSKPIQRRHMAKPLFDFDEDDGEFVSVIQDDSDSDENDPELAFALQESLDQAKVPRPITPSPKAQSMHTSSSTSASAHHQLTSRRSSSSFRHVDRESDDEDLYGRHATRLETALAIANAGPSRRLHISPQTPSSFAKPAILTATTSYSTSPTFLPLMHAPKSDSDDDMEEVLPVVSPVTTSTRIQPSPGRQPATLPGTAMKISSKPQATSYEIEEITPFQPVIQTSGSSSPTERLKVSRPESQTLPVLQSDI